MWVVGADENGLGPVLGPLVATAVLVEVPTYRAGPLAAHGRRLGLTDSKVTAGHGRMAHAEGVALAIIERTTAVLPRDADHLLRLVGLDPPRTLQRPCPGESERRQCWSPRIRLPAFGGSAADGHRRLDRLLQHGVELRSVRTALACVGVLNRSREEGRNKLLLDLGLFERLVLDARARADGEVQAYCGMVGGIRAYRERAAHLELELVSEQKGSSTYRAAGVGPVAFEVGADARHLPVALASIVGKYVRELAMERINRFYLRHDPDLHRASGYRDPVTKRFVEDSRALRRRLRLSDDCFFRRA